VPCVSSLIALRCFRHAAPVEQGGIFLEPVGQRWAGTELYPRDDVVFCLFCLNPHVCVERLLDGVFARHAADRNGFRSQAVDVNEIPRPLLIEVCR